VRWGRAASGHKLRAALVRNAPVQIRMVAFWIVSWRVAMADLDYKWTHHNPEWSGLGTE